MKSQAILIDWGQVPLLNITKKDLKAFTRGCYEVAKAHGFRPPMDAKLSLLRRVANTVSSLNARIDASPGSFKALIAEADGIPSLWTTDTASRRQLAQRVETIRMADPISPDEAQRRAFASAVEAISVLEHEVDRDPDYYAEQMGRHPVGWPVILQINYKSELPPTPRIVERLSVRDPSHLFDIFRPRRSGCPDIEGTNEITGRFLYIAKCLWGGKKFLSFDSPDRETMAIRVSEYMARPDVPSFPGLQWFLNERDDPSAAVPESPTSKATVRLLWKLLQRATETDGYPERIRELRRIVKEAEEQPLGNARDEKQIAGEILHELPRHFAFFYEPKRYFAFRNSR